MSLLVIACSCMYNSGQSIYYYGSVTVNKDDVRKCLANNSDKTLREIESISQYSYNTLYKIYKEDGDELVQAVCNACEDWCNFSTWFDLIGMINMYLPNNEQIDGYGVSELEVKNILNKIGQSEYIELPNTNIKKRELN